VNADVLELLVSRPAEDVQYRSFFAARPDQCVVHLRDRELPVPRGLRIPVIGEIHDRLGPAPAVTSDRGRFRSRAVLVVFAEPGLLHGSA
jgi:hypothetical protein